MVLTYNTLKEHGVGVSPLLGGCMLLTPGCPPAAQPDSVQHPPAEGCYIKGLFLEGARWDYTDHLLADSRPKELYTECPLVRGTC